MISDIVFKPTHVVAISAHESSIDIGAYKLKSQFCVQSLTLRIALCNAVYKFFNALHPKKQMIYLTYCVLIPRDVAF